MDVLTDWLQMLGTSTVVLARGRFAPPWGIEFERCDGVVFHLALEGQCWLRPATDAPLRIEPGDLVLLPYGAPHALVHAPHALAEPLEAVLARLQSAPPPASGIRVICGTYAAQRWLAQPLLRALPQVVHFTAAQIAANPSLTAILELLKAELDQPGPGNELLIQHLFDALFLYVIRAWVALLPAADLGWLGALSDPELGRALERMHADPGAAWTVAALAEVAGMSRAAFARRFSALVGEPPLAYLTRWRMNLAAQLLSESTHALPDVARRIGYASEFAFSRAFKRAYGVAPMTFRRQGGQHHLSLA